MKSSTPQTHSALLIPFFDTTPWFFLGKIEYNLQQWRIMIVRRLRHGLLISMILFLFVKLRSSTLKRHVMCPVVDYLNHAPHQHKKIFRNLSRDSLREMLQIKIHILDTRIVGFWKAIHHIARSLARVLFMQKLFALVWASRHFFKITIETHACYVRKDSSAISDIAYEYFANVFAVRVNGSFKDSWSWTFS